MPEPVYNETLSDLTKWEKEMAFREREVSVKEKEAKLREAEVALKQAENAKARWRSPLVVAIIAATLAGLSNAVVTVVNGLLERELEDGKAEQARVLEMVKTRDTEVAAGNLDFLLKAGLISDPGRVERLTQYLAMRPKGTGPILPSQSNSDCWYGLTSSKTVTVPRAGDQTTATFEVRAGECYWVASSEERWLTVRPNGGTGNITIVLSVEPNSTQQERSATLQVRWNGSQRGENIQVSQTAAR